MARNLYASDINKQMEKIRNEVSDRAFIDMMEIRQSFGSILKETQSEKGGPIRSSVMTFKEALKSYKKGAGKNFKSSDFTKEIYTQTLKDLVDYIKKQNRWTVNGEKENQIEHMKKVLREEDLDNALLSDYIDFNKDFDILKEAFERAKNHPMSGKSRFESGGEYITELMKNYIDLYDEKYNRG